MEEEKETLLYLVGGGFKMVYIDEKGQRYETQYCVVLNEGKDKGIKRYVWASEKQIKSAMKIIEDNVDNLSLDCTVETTFLKNPNIIACFDKEKIGSLKFFIYSEYLANFAAKETKLPLPFPNCEKN